MEKTLTALCLCKVENTSSDEQELTIVAERTSDKMTVYTSDNTWITKLNKLVQQNPKDYKIIRTDNTGSLLEVPVSLLTLRSGSRTRTKMSEEKRKECGERLKKARQNITKP